MKGVRRFKVPEHQVKQGDCISSIASLYGFYWETLWGLPENAALRDRRRNPNVLLPGDIVFVPHKVLRYEERPVDKLHKFVKNNQLVKLKICLLAAGKPIAGETYLLQVGGHNLQGKTDDSGILEEQIPPDATEATLVLGKVKLEFPLRIGYLDPLAKVSGVQGRLNNLGFHCGEVDGIVGPHTRSALLSFQETYQLDQTGKPDAATCEKLRSQHGC
jgi:hypothetical protein